MTSTPAEAREETRFALLVTAIYGALVALLLARHEPWSDELQAWMLARDSRNLGELIYNSRYEGHPLVWHLLLFGVAKLTRSFAAAQAFHGAIAACAVGLIARYAPFPRVQRVLLVFGYFIFYEYAVVARCYGIGTLLLVIACIAWSASPRRPLVAVVATVLLANTSPAGLVLAVAMATAFWVDFGWPDTATASVAGRRRLLTLGVAGAAILLMIAEVAWQVIPPAQAAYRGGGAATDRSTSSFLAYLIALPGRAHLPIPAVRSDEQFWGSSLLGTGAPGMYRFEALVSFVFIASGFFLAMRRRVAWIAYGLALLGLAALFTFGHPGFLRHHGFFFLAWVTAAWLGAPQLAPANVGIPRTPPARLESWRSAVRFAALLPPVYGAAMIAKADARQPFSDAATVAAFLVANQLDTLPIVVVPRGAGSAVAGVLDRAVYYPEEAAEATFISWGKGASRTAVERSVPGVRDYFASGKDTVVYIAKPNMVLPPQVASAKLVYSTEHPTLTDERYRVFVLRATDPGWNGEAAAASRADLTKP